MKNILIISLTKNFKNYGEDFLKNCTDYLVHESDEEAITSHMSFLDCNAEIAQSKCLLDDLIASSFDKNTCTLGLRRF